MNMKDGKGRNITERLFTENKSNVEKKHHQNHENLTKKSLVTQHLQCYFKMNW